MHPIIALWSHPRSMSTAIERIMRERGDLDAAHEPFLPDYYLHRRKRDLVHFDPPPGAPTSYEAIRNDLLKRAETKPVFFKDMSYYVMPHILEDPAFLGRLTHSFLIRDPAASIASYHALDPDMLCEEIGLEAQWALFDALGSERPRPVIDADDVRRAPKQTMRALWKALALADAPHAFDWDSDIPDDWQPVIGWHENASTTKGIRPADPTDTRGATERFERAAKDNPKLRTYLAHHQPFYDRLHAFAQCP